MDSYPIRYPPDVAEEPESSPSSTSSPALAQHANPLPYRRRRYKSTPGKRPPTPGTSISRSEINSLLQQIISTRRPDVIESLRRDIEVLDTVHRVQATYQEQLSAARSEAAVHKAQRDHAHWEIEKARRIMDDMDRQRMEAEEQSAKDRAKFRRLMLERHVEDAKEIGYDEGYNEGYKLGQVVHRSRLMVEDFTQESKRTSSSRRRNSSMSESILAHHDEREMRMKAPIYPNAMAASFQNPASSLLTRSTRKVQEVPLRSASTPPQSKKPPQAQPTTKPSIPSKAETSSQPKRSNGPSTDYFSYIPGSDSSVHTTNHRPRSNSVNSTRRTRPQKMPASSGSPEDIRPNPPRNNVDVPPVPPLPPKLNKVYGPPKPTTHATPYRGTTRASTPLSQCAMLQPPASPVIAPRQPSPTQRIVEEWRSRNSDSSPSNGPSPQRSDARNVSPVPEQVRSDFAPRSSSRHTIRPVERAIVNPVPLAATLNSARFSSPRVKLTDIYREPTPADRIPTPIAIQPPSPQRAGPSSPPRRTKTPLSWIRQQFKRSFSSPGVNIEIQPPSQTPSEQGEPNLDLNPILLTPEGLSLRPRLPEDNPDNSESSSSSSSDTDDAALLHPIADGLSDDKYPTGYDPSSRNAFFSPIPDMHAPTPSNGHGSPIYASTGTTSSSTSSSSTGPRRSRVLSFSGYGGYISPTSFSRPISLFSKE